MLKRFVLSCLTVPLLMAGIAAQAPTTPPPTTPSATDRPSVHVEGCLFTEQELTAPAPLVVTSETAYAWILTNVKPIAGPLTEDDAAKTIYAIGKLDQAQLRSFHSKRVGVVGRVGPGSPRPTLDVVSIREISGGCPTLPRVMS